MKITKTRLPLEQIIVKYCDTCAPICLPEVSTIIQEWLNQKTWIKLKGNPETRYISLDELMEELKSCVTTT